MKVTLVNITPRIEARLGLRVRVPAGEGPRDDGADEGAGGAYYY